MGAMPIINAATAADHVLESRRRAHCTIELPYKGCLPRRSIYGNIPGVKRASAVFAVIPRDEWKDRIKAEQGSFLQDTTRGVLPPHDQGRTNYCWCHGSVRAVEMSEVHAGRRPKLLSALSIARPLTGGWNRGGTPDEALQQLRSHGACSTEFWNDANRDADTGEPGWEQNALENMIVDWLDVRGWDMQISLAFYRRPIAIGLRWWGHLVCQLGPCLLPNGEVGIEFDNSWGDDYGDHGRGILDEKHGTADLGAFAPLTETYPD